MRSFEYHATHNSCGDGKASHNSHAHQTLLVDFVLDQLAQALRLQIVRLDLHEVVVVSLRFSIVAEFVVSEGDVVEAFSSSLGALAVDVGEEADAFLLVAAVRGFDQALKAALEIPCAPEGRGTMLYPCEVELGLQRDVFALLLVL